MLWSPLALLGLAHAGVVGVVTDVRGGPLPEAALQSIVWHGLIDTDREPVLFGGTVDGAARQAYDQGVHTLLAVELQWVRDPTTPTNARRMPRVHVVEYDVTEDGPDVVHQWSREEPPALFEVPDGLVSLPEVAVQRAIDAFLGEFDVPAQPRSTEHLLAIPVVVAADDEYIDRYGNDWQAVALRRVERASVLLAPAGLSLKLVGLEAWETPAEEDLRGILGSLSKQPIAHPNALRVGFTAQIDLDPLRATPEQVGRAHLPGRDLVVVDQREPAGHDEHWDVVEEGVAIAHELLHLLGAPHLEHSSFLMSGDKHATVHVMAPSTASVAQTAAWARWGSMSPKESLERLHEVADRFMTDDPELQVAYLATNTQWGDGVEEGASWEPRSLPALTNLAVARTLLEQAKKQPSLAERLRKRALEHGSAAMLEQPEMAEPLMERLGAPTPREACTTKDVVD